MILASPKFSSKPLMVTAKSLLGRCNVKVTCQLSFTSSWQSRFRTESTGTNRLDFVSLPFSTTCCEWRNCCASQFPHIPCFLILRVRNLLAKLIESCVYKVIASQPRNPKKHNLISAQNSPNLPRVVRSLHMETRNAQRVAAILFSHIMDGI